MPRYAIYFTPPPGHALARIAALWLGRDAFGEGPAEGEPGAAEWVAEPRRYGFHATLKAPFRLAEGASAEELRAALRDFAATTRVCPLGRLCLARPGNFLALAPERTPPALAEFAGRVVEAFDRFRAPPSEAERLRRRRAPLDATALALLERWGYPYVFERFRFHMSLTGPLAADQLEAAQARLEQRFAAVLTAEIRIDALTLFIEERQGADFRVCGRFPLAA